ncbi:MAG: hypothetical protein ACN2B6_07300 [Rickettsiales bacterium]
MSFSIRNTVFTLAVATAAMSSVLSASTANAMNCTLGSSKFCYCESEYNANTSMCTITRTCIFDGDPNNTSTNTTEAPAASATDCRLRECRRIYSSNAGSCDVFPSSTSTSGGSGLGLQ